MNLNHANHNLSVFFHSPLGVVFAILALFTFFFIPRFKGKAVGFLLLLLIVVGALAYATT